MIKCEVLERCFVSVEKGTIVEVNERQFELLRHKLKVLKKEEKKEIAKSEGETIEKIENEVPVKETRNKKK